MPIRAITALLFAVLATGCADDLPVPESGTKGKVALAGELTAGEIFSIRAGQSVAVGSKEVSIPQGLTITVKDDEGGVWTISGVRDGLSDTLRTVALSSSTIFIRAGKKYTITTAHPTLDEASAEVTIPQAITAALLDTVRMQQTVGPVLRANIRIDDAPGEHFYVVEAVKQPMGVKHEFFFGGQWRDVTAERMRYDSLQAAGASFPERRDTTFGQSSSRIPLYTDDPVTENVSGGSANPTTYRRVLLTDRTFRGGTHTTAVSVSSNSFVALTAEERGRVRLQVKSVSKDYFDFLRRYELNQPEVAGEPDALQGNVVGGYGAVGGASRVEWVWVFDAWE